MNPKEPKIERLTASSRFRFRCTRCTQCCRHVKQGVPIDSQDIYNISKYLQSQGTKIFSTDDFLIRYGDPALLDECGYFVYFLKSTGKDDACIFLKGDQCTIQNCKPKTCRLYPMVIEPNPNGKIPYILSHEREHHFSGPAITARSWMNKQLSEEDQTVLQIEYGHAPELAALLMRIPYSLRTEAVLHLQRLKYSEFDLSQPFLPQFRRNMTKLKAILYSMANPSQK